MKRYFSLIILLIAVLLFKSYVYAYTEYKVGDVVPYNDMEFYVIKDSSSKDDSVTMLKNEPLTFEEIETYSVGTGASISGNGMKFGETSEYSKSYVKMIIDAWMVAKINEKDLLADSTGYKSRLFTIDDLIENLGYELVDNGSVIYGPLNEKVPNWVWKNNQYPLARWTMSQYGDSTSRVWRIDLDGKLVPSNVNEVSNIIRPVITLKKTALGDDDESIVDKDDKTTPNTSNNVSKNNDNKNNTSTNKKQSSVKVNVANTYMKASLLIIILGFILACVSVVMYYIIKKKGSSK